MEVKKVIGVLVLTLLVSGFVMAQTVTKENVKIEYDSAKKVVRLTNGNADPYSVQYTIDGKGKTVVLDKNAVWEQTAAAAPKAVDIVKATKGGKVGAVDKEWKAVTTAAPAAAAPAATPAPAPAPAKK